MKNASEMNEGGSEKSQMENIIFIVLSSFRNFSFLANSLGNKIALKILRVNNFILFKALNAHISKLLSFRVVHNPQRNYLRANSLYSLKVLRLPWAAKSFVKLQRKL